MKIVLDARHLSQRLHGIARYTENLIRYLPLESNDCYIVLYHPNHFTPWEHPQIEWYPCPISFFSLQEQISLPRLLKKLSPDLFHAPSYVVPYHIPCPYLMTLHDLIHVHFAKDYSKFHQIYYQYWTRRLACKAKMILTV